MQATVQSAFLEYTAMCVRVRACLHMCTLTRVHACGCIGQHMHMQRPEIGARCYSPFSILLFDTKLSLNSEFTVSHRSVGQQAPGSTYTHSPVLDI